MKKAIIYARYSSERQTEQSIEGQLRVCYDYAKQNGLIILQEYIDRAMSGTNDNRRQFQQMLSDSEKTLTSGNIAAFEHGLIKLDTSINNGNSGGPLFNVNGEIIGIINLKLGKLSNSLENVEQTQPKIKISMEGIDAIETIQQMLREMQKNINLGIGYAIPSDTIANNVPLIQSIIK